jgi:phosphoglycolate phosphatase
MIKAVLFDLDGTLADTAPDLGAALNRMRAARGLDAVPIDKIRPCASHGARGLLGLGFDVSPADDTYEALRDEFLDLYEHDLFNETQLFPGVAELLNSLEARGLPWGVVTNKAERFALPLLELMALTDRAACIIGGDTTGKTKPHPEPLLAASRRINVPPGDCIYVGDDRRDVEAALAAGMRSAVAKYGYLNGSDPLTWGATWLISRPTDLLTHI